MMNRKKIIIAAIFTVILLISGGVYWYFTNSRTVTVHFDQVESASVIDDSGAVVKELTSSGQTARLFGDEEHRIDYEGKEGYANGSYVLDNDESVITLSPNFSETRKITYYQENKSHLESLLRDNYTNYHEYSVKDYSVYKRGEWVFVILKYNGEYGYSSDDLRTGFKLEDDKWNIIADPTIVLTKYNTENIPTDILQKINALR